MGVNDPARTLEDPSAAIVPSVSTEVMPVDDGLTIGDKIIQEIMVRMVMGDWDGRRSADELALKHQRTRGSMLQYAVIAGRFLRIQQTPEAMFEWIVARLRAVVEADQPDRVAAMKVLLDQLERMEKRRGNRPQDKLTPEQEDARLDALLDDPPPRLLERLAAKGWKK